jgi:hypothetical protein
MCRRLEGPAPRLLALEAVFAHVHRKQLTDDLALVVLERLA